VEISATLIVTIIAFVFAVPLRFFAARNLTNSWPLRIFTKRLMEFLSAFPEIVIAGLFSAILSIGPVAAIIAITLHTIG
ncbi:PhnE/PtxC family ABC transporter permease, partial [Rhizobium ruizarguesonis]